MRAYIERSRSFIAERFRDINRQLLYAGAVLVLYGVFLIFAASPGVAYRTNRETFYFINLVNKKRSYPCFLNNLFYLFYLILIKHLYVQ